jgi:hypothetical protein
MSEEGKPEVKEQPVEVRHDPSVSRAPEYKARFGRVEAAVWSRGLDEGRMAYSVTLQRSYQDRDGKWQRTTSLDEGDMLPAAKALEDAYTWIQEQRQHSREEAFHELQVPPRVANS